MLSPSAEETLPTQNKAKKGKMRVEEQESNTFELLSLLTEMRDEIKRRDE